MKYLTKYLVALLFFITVTLVFSTSAYAICSNGLPRGGCGALQQCPLGSVSSCCTTINECTSPATLPQGCYWKALRVPCNSSEKLCSATGSIPDLCCPNNVSCPTSIQPPPAAGGGQSCFQNCMATGGSTPAECNAMCGLTATSGTGSVGDPSKMLVNLSTLISDLTTLSGGKFGKLTSLSGIMTVLLPLLYVIAGIALLIYLIVGGFAYLTSAGDPKKMESAKTIITHAIMGFVLVIVAFWITQVVNYIFGLGAPV